MRHFNLLYHDWSLTPVSLINMRIYQRVRYSQHNLFNSLI
jgi:hypothetical protein